MIPRAIVALALAVASLAPAAAHDMLPFPEAHLPGVCCLKPEPHGFVVTLCGPYSQAWEGVDARERVGISREQSRPRVALRGNDRWTWLDPVDPRTDTCDAPAPGGSSSILSAESGGRATLPPGCPDATAALLPVLSEDEARRLRPDLDPRLDPGGQQETGGCVAHGGYVFVRAVARWAFTEAAPGEPSLQVEGGPAT